ncbi:MAG: helix-turn-helix domain-containing protein [Turicibacter sp.]
MKEINMASMITRKRKEKQLTQDDLATYMGVSKAAISKWETGQSYPDITFLPILAAFFNISIDELMGYEPQMVKEDIKKLYERLCLDFASKPFELVIDECETLIKKYYSCFPLLQKIGLLLVNHSMLAKTPDETIRLNKEAKTLFERVKLKSDDVELAKQSLQLEVYCHLLLGEAQQALQLLGDTNQPVVSTEVMKATAHQMLGQMHEAKASIQVGFFTHLVDILQSYPMLLTLSLSSEKQFETLLQKLQGLDDLFEIRKMHPYLIVPIMLTAATCYTQLGNIDKAIQYLEEYYKLTTTNFFPLKIKGNEFFDLIEDWLKENGMEVAPRSEKVIKQSMIEALIQNSAFLSLQDDERFIDIVEKLKFNL